MSEVYRHLLKTEGIPPLASLRIRNTKGRPNRCDERGGNYRQRPIWCINSKLLLLPVWIWFYQRGRLGRQPGEQRMLCEYRGDTKNSPPALIPDKTSQQLIVHLLCKNSLKISRRLGTERHHQLQPLNCQAVANSSSEAAPPQNRRWEITMGRKQEVFSSPSTE